MENTITSGNFTFTKTSIEGVIVVEAKKFPDSRGYFAEAYKKCDFEVGGIADDFVQENQSYSIRGVIRGLHYQKRYPQSKLVRVLKGEAFDVAVDLRKESPTFGKWHGEMLSADNGKQLYLPHGCAHGIMIVSEDAIFSYKTDDVFHPEDEAGLIWFDKDLGIEWPFPFDEVVTSGKDKLLPGFKEAFEILYEL